MNGLDQMRNETTITEPVHVEITSHDQYLENVTTIKAKITEGKFPDINNAIDDKKMTDGMRLRCKPALGKIFVSHLTCIRNILIGNSAASICSFKTKDNFHRLWEKYEAHKQLRH
ncbi:DNA replication ATP-dependent helicase/nuclease DNA2 [Dirofilaria immitis]